MKTFVVVGVVIGAQAAFAQANADESTGSGSDVSGFWVTGSESQPADRSGPSPESETADSSSAAEPILLGTGACVAADPVAGEFLSVSFCESETDQSALSILSTIRNAFARLDLPAGTLVVQPPDGLTLVNFDTNFYTTSTEPLTRVVTLLGRRVTLEATPATYTWDFGDGETLATSDPGAAYPDLRVTHNYRLTGRYRPSLSTTYTGRFRVGGGPWRQIPGTVTIDGVGQPLRAIEARPTLVGY